MKIRERRSGVFRIDFRWPDGQRTRRDMPDFPAAAKLAKKIEVAMADEDRIWRKLRKELRMGTESIVTFADLADMFFAQHVQPNNRDARTSASRLSILKAHFGNQPIDALTPRHAAAFFAAKRRDGASNATVNRYRSLLSKMFSWAIEQEIVEVSPFGKLTKAKEPRPPLERPSDEAIDAVFAKLHPSLLPIYVFLRDTGCRRGEAVVLRHHQVDYANQAITVQKTKNGRQRQVPMTDNCLWAVQALPRLGETVFYHPGTMRPFLPDTVTKIWDRARVGITHLRVHDLRHAFAIKLAEGGCPMHHISAVLGHDSSIQFTRDYYADFSPESSSREVLRVLQGRKAVGNSWTPEQK